MPRFIGVVTELQAIERRYEAEANNAQEAAEKMAIGDTVYEVTIKNNGVVDRTVNSTPTEII